MRLKFIAALLVFAQASFLQASFAQTAPDWRTALHDLYLYEVAFDACKDVTPSAADMLRLEAAIAYVEEKTGLEEDELDELFGTVERDAEKVDEFCKQMADAVARVRALPESYR